MPDHHTVRRRAALYGDQRCAGYPEQGIFSGRDAGEGSDASVSKTRGRPAQPLQTKPVPALRRAHVSVPGSCGDVAR